MGWYKWIHLPSRDGKIINSHAENTQIYESDNSVQGAGTKTLSKDADLLIAGKVAEHLIALVKKYADDPVYSRFIESLTLTESEKQNVLILLATRGARYNETLAALVADPVIGGKLISINAVLVHGGNNYFDAYSGNLDDAQAIIDTAQSTIDDQVANILAIEDYIKYKYFVDTFDYRQLLSNIQFDLKYNNVEQLTIEQSDAFIASMYNNSAYHRPVISTEIPDAVINESTNYLSEKQIQRIVEMQLKALEKIGLCARNLRR